MQFAVTTLLALSLFAQTQKVSFDVVSIKVNRSGERGFSTGGISGGRYTARNIPGRILVAQAFGVRENRIAGAPAWLESERYDIVAKAGPNSTPDQLQTFLQAMLMERLKLTFHRETRNVPGYSLIVSRGGPKIKLNNGGQTPDLNSTSNGAGAKIWATKVPVSALAKQLEGALDCPVADKTGLTGDYDFQLEWTHDQGQGEADPSFLCDSAGTPWVEISLPLHGGPGTAGAEAECGEKYSG